MVIQFDRLPGYFHISSLLLLLLLLLLHWIAVDCPGLSCITGVRFFMSTLVERYTDWMDNEIDMGEQSGAPGSLSYSSGVQECEL